MLPLATFKKITKFSITHQKFVSIVIVVVAQLSSKAKKISSVGELELLSSFFLPLRLFSRIASEGTGQTLSRREGRQLRRIRVPVGSPYMTFKKKRGDLGNICRNLAD